jgi:hypothetical protein
MGVRISHELIGGNNMGLSLKKQIESVRKRRSVFQPPCFQWLQRHFNFCHAKSVQFTPLSRHNLAGRDMFNQTSIKKIITE